MAVEVTTPEEYMGDVIGDLSAKRGQIQEMTDRGNSKVVRSLVPLSSMFGYATSLRSMSQGRAAYAMEFHSSIADAAVDAKKTLRRVTTYTQRPDHPILATIPETEYLRGYAYEVVASW